MNKKNEILNQDGQALIEFILFLPFILMMYSVTLSVSNALNAGINAQKITRGYFYYRAMNNSAMPKPRRDNPIYNRFRIFGMQASGWAEGFKGESPLKSCYKFRVPLGSDEEEVPCDEKYSNRVTQFIKIGTVYGICAETHITESGEVQKALHNVNPLLVISGDEACSLRN